MRHKPSFMVRKIDGVGVDLSRFYPVSSVEEKIFLRREKNYSEHDFMLIYTAEFIPRKNHRLLFDILPGLRERIPGLKAVLCGKGESCLSITEALRRGRAWTTCFLPAIRRMWLTGAGWRMSSSCRAFRRGCRWR